MLNKKIYNRFFHLHTISGIVVSIALFVIFFAGSFSFFRDEIVNWERGHQAIVKDEIAINIDTALYYLSQQYDLSNRDISFGHYYNERRINTSLTGSKDSTATQKNKEGAFFYLDTEDKSMANYTDSYSLGELLYRLHFFAQIPYPFGYYLSGFVAFFTLFVLITGLLIHWDKIVSHFYLIRTWAGIKTIWTDSHTSLGLIGFPFQLVYALTGAFFMIKAITFAPYVIVLFNSDEAQFSKEIGLDEAQYELSYQTLETVKNIEPYLDKVKQKWDNIKITNVKINNYGDANMHLYIKAKTSPKENFNGIAEFTYRLSDDHVIQTVHPEQTSYVSKVENMLDKLHYADYGGLPLRIISFLLGLVSCYVILSGVMIWIEARNKKNIPPRQRKFNLFVVRIYMAICLSLFPMIAAQFIIVKYYPSLGMSGMYSTFFKGWLILLIVFFFLKDTKRMLLFGLAIGALLSLLIPIVNGVFTGMWPWHAYSSGMTDILVVDLLWIILGLISIWTIRLLWQKKTTSTAALQ